MSHVNDSQLQAPRRISIFGMIVIGFVAVILILLVMPSAKSNRLIKAKEYLAREFPIVTEESVKPLLKAYLVKDGEFVNFSNRDECAVFIFRPDPAIYGSENMIAESSISAGSYPISNPSDRSVPVALLLAPDESHAGWTVFSKLWIAKVLLKQQVKDLKDLGISLNSNPKAFARLKTIWAKVSEQTKEKATAILDENRRIANLYKSTRRFYRRKVTYSIPDQMELWAFFNAYDNAHPEHAKSDDQ